ncbi:MAG TPA: VWA domain-containing protein, partial [Planctomycetaceae bacterium]|nr:VWA domain-containing protein [Planctomycetaceae bacterium]
KKSEVLYKNQDAPAVMAQNLSRAAASPDAYSLGFAFQVARPQAQGQSAGQVDSLKRSNFATLDESLPQLGTAEGLPPQVRFSYQVIPSDAEAYDPIFENPFRSAYEDPLSTFGVDVDTASYSNLRRFLTNRQLPPPNAVRIEELVNYFSYDYPQPAPDQLFSVNVDARNCPWSREHSLVRIGVKGKEMAATQRPPSNLVFLVDVSGSMQAENKLPLVKMGLNLLTQQLTESDRVAIVTYADTAGLRLESTNGSNKAAILQTIDSLQAQGSTNGAEGIQLAYRAAIDHFIEGGTNRVILCTDGDFNVGVTGDDELVALIRERARTKVFFSVLGFGMGNLKDGKLEKLADKGNGHYAYIDNQREARKMFVDELTGTLITIAKDVKIQVEFNPKQVAAYRLIGYENRVMPSQDFNDDKKDGGEFGAGHAVTALYEIVAAGKAPQPALGDTLRYRASVVPQDGALAGELLTVKLRYKLPEGEASALSEFPVTAASAFEFGQGARPAASQTRMQELNWAAAVAAFGMILRNSQFRGEANFDMVLKLAQEAKGADRGGHRQEFMSLVAAAKSLCTVEPAGASDRPTPLTREQAEIQASVNGKYKNLLRIIEAPGDGATHGEFHDYGRWEGTDYLGQSNLPKGYWVYVHPNWYIWGDAAK